MEFDSAILQIADNLNRTLQFVSPEIKYKCEEIRLRSGMPVSLTINGKVNFVCQDSAVCSVLPKNPLIATSETVQKTLALLCKNSIFLHENEIKQGFVSLSNGCRAGVCGVFNAEGMLVSVSSINIRIARQILGCGNALLPYVKGGLLIAGPPGSGKTTILRDVIRLLSNGEDGQYYRVAVIDSRGEISGDMFDIGVSTDILHTPQKSTGVDIALRTMSPQFIVFDEIGTMTELESIQNCFNSGVGIITTAHCSGKEELLRRNITREIIKSGTIKHIALLSENLGQSPQILSCEELEKCLQLNL